MFTSSILITSEQSVEHLLNKLALSQGETTLIQVFSNQSPNRVELIVQQLQRRFVNAQVIGMSAVDVIHHGDIHHNATLIVFSQFERVSLTATVIPHTENIESDTKQLFERLHLNQDSKAIICLVDRIEQTFPERWTQFSHYSSVPIFGGSSCSGGDSRWVMLNGQFYEHALVAVALSGRSLQLLSNYYAQWNPIGRTFRVTLSNGRELLSLDDIPVQQVYRNYLGDKQGLPVELLQHFPLIRGTMEDQDVFQPIDVTERGIVFNREIEVGDEVRFCFDHPTLTIDQVQVGAYQLRQFKPEQIFIYNCFSRIDFMEGNQELQPLQSVADTYGSYCFGELMHDGIRQRVLHHSMTYVALREGDVAKPSSYEQEKNSNNIIEPIFSLIRNAFSDLDIMNRDLEQKIQTQASLLMATYRKDKRTGLPNREVLRERLSAMGSDEHLITLKLTNFSRINEKYGYLVGDRLLQDLSDNFLQYIETMLTGRSQLYAIGVAEWACIFRSEYDSEYIHKKFSQFVDRLENYNFEPYGLPEVDYLSVSLCAGFVSRRDFPHLDKDELLLRSIEARRFAHNQNRHFYCASKLRERDDIRQEQLGWLSCVSRAVLDDNVQVYAQPLFEAKTHALSSYECLVRIEDDGEIILPGRFLPIIEGTHLYSRLSRQMITRTFELMRSRDECFSINLAPQDFMSDRTLNHLEDAIRLMGDPSRVGLEVLETEQIKDYGHMIEVCNHFRSLGVSIIVDDFGCGYSNIDEIVKLEPQVIKLDGSLIRNIDTDIKQRKIAQQLVKLCQVLEAKTVAEFVHNEEVCRISEDMGIDYLQGFHLGAPKRLI